MSIKIVPDIINGDINKYKETLDNIQNVVNRLDIKGDMDCLIIASDDVQESMIGQLGKGCETAVGLFYSCNV